MTETAQKQVAWRGFLRINPYIIEKKPYNHCQKAENT
jgi:hypothetical protein